MAVEYQRLRIIEGKTEELNELAKEGWTIVSGSLMGSQYLTFVLLERTLPTRRNRKPAVQPEETKEE